MVVGRFAHWPSAVFAAMIPEQLDLFGGPPRPPKRIREEEPDTSSATPEPAPVPVNDDTLMATTPIPEPAEMPMVPTAVELPEPSQDEPMPDWIVEQSALAEEEPTLSEEEADAIADEVTEVLNEQLPAEAIEPVVLPEVATPVSEVIAWIAPEPIRHTATAADETEEDKLTENLIEPVSDIVVEFPAEKKPSPIAAATTEVGTPAQMNVPPDEELFKRQYYSMRETAAMFDISHSMLRYWENEFEVLQPRKNRKGDRYFRPIDVKHLQLIYHLLKVRKFTIEGAREYLRNHNKALDTFELIKKLEKLKSFLLELKANVS